jgi:predicted ArsR family transcriptional regulator
MTYEEVLKYTYASWFIPMMKVLAEDMGDDALNEMIKNASSEVARQKGEQIKKSKPDNNLSTFAQFFEKPNHILENGAIYEIVENNGTVLELKVSECLWAKVFRDANAAKIGHSYVCYADFDMVQGFNPKIVLHRDKTLMQGDSYCNHRYVLET